MFAELVLILRKLRIHASVFEVFAKSTDREEDLSIVTEYSLPLKSVCDHIEWSNDVIWSFHLFSLFLEFELRDLWPLSHCRQELSNLFQKLDRELSSLDVLPVLSLLFSKTNCKEFER